MFEHKLRKRPAMREAEYDKKTRRSKSGAKDLLGLPYWCDAFRKEELKRRPHARRPAREGNIFRLTALKSHNKKKEGRKGGKR